MLTFDITHKNIHYTSGVVSSFAILPLFALCHWREGHVSLLKICGVIFLSQMSLLVLLLYSAGCQPLEGESVKFKHEEEDSQKLPLHLLLNILFVLFRDVVRIYLQLDPEFLFIYKNSLSQMSLPLLVLTPLETCFDFSHSSTILTSNF